MNIETRDNYMDGNEGELRDRPAERNDCGRGWNRCGFSYNTDFGMLDEGGDSDV